MGRSKLRSAFVAFVVVVAGWHAVGVTAAAVPENQYSSAVDVTTRHLSPYFTQNWRLFAPNPISEDRSLKFQAAFVGESGQLEQTEWVNWTDVELDLIHHRVVGNRGGYVTNKLIESLSAASRRLTTEQRDAAAATPMKDPLTWAELTDRLVDEGAEPQRARSYVLYEQAATRLATDVLAARFPEQEFVSVRYSVELLPVVSYQQRNDINEPPRKAIVRESGWREPIEADASEREIFVDFDRRHR